MVFHKSSTTPAALAFCFRVAGDQDQISKTGVVSMPDKKTPECSKHKTSRGVPWSKVRAEELPGMVQDGIVASALLKAMRDLNKDDLDR